MTKSEESTVDCLGDLVDSVKKWRAALHPFDLKHLHPTLREIADNLDRYQRAITEAVEAEFEEEERRN